MARSLLASIGRKGSHVSMALSASLIEEKYGRVLRAPPYDSLATARLLYRKLEERMPRVTFCEQALKTWIQKYRGAVVVAPVGGAGN